MAQRPDTPDDSRPLEDTRPFPGPVPERGHDPREDELVEKRRNPSEAPEPREEDRRP